MVLASGIFQVAVMCLFPFVLWFALTRRLRVSWRYVGLGAATWLSAMPFFFVVTAAASVLFSGSPLAPVIALSLAAGIFEETSRFLYYRASRALRDSANWNIAVVAGAAHGGTESILMGIQALLGVIVVFWFPHILPPEFREIEPTVSFYALGALSRVMILIIHIGLTMLVWRAVSRRQIAWYAASVVIHVALNLICFGQPILLPEHEWIGWLVLAVAFAGALWIVQIHRPTKKVAVSGELQPAENSV